MKGIILAGGKATRLYPATSVTCKQLLPVYDKPMIYYPLSTLMSAGIREVLIISTPQDLPKFKELFGDGTQLGMHIYYKEQTKPNGIAEAFLIGEEFIGKQNVCLILGDNIFHSPSLGNLMYSALNQTGATIFAYKVHDPKRYGVIEFNKKGKVISIEEKPEQPKSDYASVGLYFYDNSVIEYVKKLKPSARGELEITDLNNVYLKKGTLKVIKIPEGSAWLDAGTHSSLIDSSIYIKTIEDRQGIKIGCIEEIAFKQGFINKKQFINLIEKYQNIEYGRYLKNLI